MDQEFMSDEQLRMLKADIEVLCTFCRKENFSGLSKEECMKLDSEVRKHDPALTQPLTSLVAENMLGRINNLRSGWQDLEVCHLFIPALNKIFDTIRGDLHKLGIYDLSETTLALPAGVEIACLTHNQSLRGLWMAFHAVLNEFEKAVYRQGDLSAANVQVLHSSIETETVIKDQPTYSTSAEEKLIGWRELLGAIKRPYGDESIRQIKRLNDLNNGPIRSPGRGAQVIVGKEKLLEWWNVIENRDQEIADRRRDCMASTSDTYNHGRNAVVVPEINGSIKQKKAKGNQR